MMNRVIRINSSAQQSIIQLILFLILFFFFIPIQRWFHEKYGTRRKFDLFKIRFVPFYASNSNEIQNENQRNINPRTRYLSILFFTRGKIPRLPIFTDKSRELLCTLDFFHRLTINSCCTGFAMRDPSQ